MARKHDLLDWLYEALASSQGRGRIPDLCAYVWENHQNELRASGDLFYTWQYDIRWAAYQLRRSGHMKSAKNSPQGVWELTGV